MTKTQLKELYCKRRLSMMEIAHRLHTTHATVLYWLKKHRIPRRSWSASTYAKLNPNGDPFRIVRTLTERQRLLLAAGLLLYWAEGAKKNKTSVQLGNLDGRMLQVFAKFLREVCQVDEQRLKGYVRIHKQFSRPAARRYWRRLLRLPASQVYIYHHTDTRSKPYQQWSPYGLAVLVFPNTKFKAWLDRAIEDYITFLLNPRRNPKFHYPMRPQHGNLLADGTPGTFDLMATDEEAPHLTVLPWDTQATQNN